MVQKRWDIKMKNTRRGMGIGRGCGYYNIAPMDSHIHSLSAKGVKSLSQMEKKAIRKHLILSKLHFQFANVKPKTIGEFTKEENIKEIDHLLKRLNAKGCNKEICEEIKELRKLERELTTSDLQGVAGALASKIGKELNLVKELKEYGHYPDVEEELLSYAYGKQTLEETEQNIKNMHTTSTLSPDEEKLWDILETSKNLTHFIWKASNETEIDNFEIENFLKKKGFSDEEIQNAVHEYMDRTNTLADLERLKEKTKDKRKLKQINDVIESKYLSAKGENVIIVKGVNGWRIENDKGKILVDKVFNNHLDAFDYYKKNKQLLFFDEYVDKDTQVEKILGQVAKKHRMYAKGYTDAYIDYHKLKKGTKVKFYGRRGVLTSDSEYVSGGSWGGYQARIKWNDGEETTWSLNKTGMKFWGTLPKKQKITGKTKDVYAIVYWNKSRGQRDLAGNNVWTSKKDAEQWIKAKTKDVWTKNDYKNYKIKKFKVGKDEFQPVLGDWVYDRGQVHFARSQWQGD
jgi:hypothetical protein